MECGLQKFEAFSDKGGRRVAGSDSPSLYMALHHINRGLEQGD